MSTDVTFKAILSNPDLWDGEVTYLSLVRFFATVDAAREGQQMAQGGDRAAATTAGQLRLKIGAIVLTPHLHYVVEFMDSSNPQGGFKIISEDVVECITDVTVHQDYHDGECASHLFEMKTFGSTFVFCVWEYSGEAEGMRGEAAKRASKKLGRAFQSLPCVSYKNDYLGGALDGVVGGGSGGGSAGDFASPVPPTVILPKGVIKPVQMVGTLESTSFVQSFTNQEPGGSGGDGGRRSGSHSPSPRRGSLAVAESMPSVSVSQLSSLSNGAAIHTVDGADRAALAACQEALIQQHRMLMAEGDERRALQDTESSEREVFLLRLGTAWHRQVDHGKLAALLEEMKQLHTTIDTYELFDPVDADNNVASGHASSIIGNDASPTGTGSRFSGTRSQSFSAGSPDGATGLRRKLSFKFGGGSTVDPESRMSLFSSYANDDAKKLASDFEKIARQKCHKYYTGQQRALVEKRKLLESELNGKKVREAATKFEEERSHLHSQLDLAIRELRRLKALSEKLTLELSKTQQREQSVLERSRRREQELSQFTSPTGAQPSGGSILSPKTGGSYTAGRASSSSQQAPSQSQGRASGFNFFASTPHQ